MLRVIEDQAAAHGYRKVVAVSLEVGALAGVEVEALRFGFDVVMKDSIAEGARLDVTVRPALAWCDVCSRRVGVAQRWQPCPLCGAHGLQVEEGEALLIKELEVE